MSSVSNKYSAFRAYFVTLNLLRILAQAFLNDTASSGHRFKARLSFSSLYTVCFLEYQRIEIGVSAIYFDKANLLFEDSGKVLQ